MRSIKSKDTFPERVMAMILRAQGFKMELWPDLPGHPDVLIDEFKCVIFVHGCFWHGCWRHYHLPKTNKEFWANKIAKNIERHKRNRIILEKMGYKVLTVWEHDLK